MVFYNLLYIKILLSLITSTVCITGDFAISSKQTQVVRALLDNATHGLVGLFASLIIVFEFRDQLHINNCFALVAACFLMSSFIDLDHFLAARSLSLKDATSLTSRPILHCTTIPLLIFLLFLCAIKTNQTLSCNLWIAMVLCAFLTHHIRDATRRGLWIWPVGDTKPVPYILYIVGVVLVPHLLNLVLSFGQYAVTYSKVRNEPEMMIV